ncbi:hypothetical protein Dimus_035733, partial [Dionaea muscipula]
CNSKIWKERHFKLHGFDIYGSSNDKEEVVRTVRRDDAPEEEEEEEEERNKDDFDREVVIDEATTEGNQCSMINFMMLKLGEEEPKDVNSSKDQAIPTSSSTSTEDQELAGVDPLVPLAEKPTFRNFKRSSKERGQTDFMMNWRRPKLRMPNF